MEYKKFFTTTLLQWNVIKNKREMPWKGEKDPYKIWVSEIILQQTRVGQGTNYYNRFIRHFPTIKSLANAPEKKIFKLWEGLGYYNRCRNLIETAKFIDHNLEGKFPEKYEDILALKGIGNYTASAIASFAFDQPYAVLDGNVFRVLSRFFGVELSINSSEGKRIFSDLSQLLLDKKHPAAYNQAIMDFGAVVCKPSLPLCGECVLRKKCFAFRNNKVGELPFNTKVIRQKTRFFNYIIAEYNNKFYIRKRIEKDIWQNLYEFILIETKSPAKEEDVLSNEKFVSIFGSASFETKLVSKQSSQKLTHQIIQGNFVFIKISKPLKNNDTYFLATKKEINLLPFPKLITTYFTDKNYL
ncbi:MAG TPA: A/G-specific adenine glycosylase [Hanamia sp.]